MFRGAAHGLLVGRGIGVEHVEVVCEQLYLGCDLSSLYAAEILAADPVLSGAAMDKLVARSGVETDTQRAARLSRALAAAPDVASPHLKRMIASSNVLERGVAWVAFEMMGERAIDCLRDLIKGDLEEVCQLRLLELVEGMGRAAAPLQDDLLRILEEDAGDVVSRQVLAILGSIGRGVEEAAVTKVVEYVSHPCVDVAREAESALIAIGDLAEIALSGALARASGDMRDRYGGVLALLRPLRASDFGPLQHVDRRLLKRFVVLGEYLEKGPMGLRQMAQEIVKRKDLDLGIGYSEKALGDALNDLAVILDEGPLTTKGRKKSGVLTDWGSTVLRKAADLLLREDAQKKVDKERDL